jgi:hypothetical protein
VEERQFLFLETGQENHRAYYRVTADGVECRALHLFACSLVREAPTLRKNWKSGAIWSDFASRLRRVNMRALAWSKNGRLNQTKTSRPYRSYREVSSPDGKTNK